MSSNSAKLAVTLLGIVFLTCGGDKGTENGTGNGDKDQTPPAAVTDLGAVRLTSMSVTLTWTAPGDDGDSGAASQYDIRYSTDSITEGNWTAATPASGEPVPKPAGQQETFVVSDLDSSATYYFALKAADEVPNWSTLSNVPKINGLQLTHMAWWPLGSGTNGAVTSLTVYSDQLIAGGAFTTAGGIPANHVAAWDGESWSALGSGMSGNVKALAVYDGRLVAGGAFGVTTWDASSWSPVGSGLGMDVAALTVYEGHLIAGGALRPGSVVTRVAAWDGTSWSQVGSGVNSDVSALTVHSRLLIAGGWASLLVEGNALADWDGISWNPLGFYSERNPGPVSTLAVYNGRLIAGGRFDYAAGAAAHGIAAWYNDSWHSLGLGMGRPNTYHVLALTEYNAQLIAGGLFSSAGGVSARSIAAWNGASWSSLGVGVDGVVYALAAYNGRLIAGGEFTAAGGTAVSNIAYWSE